MTETRNPTEKESFASRWSKRKRQVKLEQSSVDLNTADVPEELSEAGVPGTELAASEYAESEQRRAEKLARLNTLKDEDMPDIASLNEESDFSQFMSTNVSEALRKVALHKLFHGKTYNIRDGLDEYDGDYTSFEKLDPSTITSDMRYRQELEAEKLKELQEQEQLEHVQALSDDDSTQQQETDDLPEEAALTEDDDNSISNEEPQDPDTQLEAQTETQAVEHQQSDARITTKTTGENKT